MDEKSERLNDTAKKAQRNLLFFALAAWALALGWIEITGRTSKVSFGGVGAETTLEVILWFLFAMQAYSLFSFWLHGPFGDSRGDERKYWMMNPSTGSDVTPSNLYNSVLKIAGAGAWGRNVQEWKDFQALMAENGIEDRGWRDMPNDRREGILELWGILPKATIWRLKRAALIGPAYVRRLMIEDFADVWIPVVIGGSGSLAVGIGLGRLVYY